jgi:hypothetical protein
LFQRTGIEMIVFSRFLNDHTTANWAVYYLEHTLPACMRACLVYVFIYMQLGFVAMQGVVWDMPRGLL